jgi:hypothetical protein
MFSQREIISTNRIESQLMGAYDTLSPKNFASLKLAKNDLIRIVAQINNNESLNDINASIKNVQIFLYSMSKNYHDRIYSALKVEAGDKDYYFSYGKDEFALTQRGIKTNSAYFECLIEELFDSKTSSIGHRSIFVNIHDNKLTKLLVTDKLGNYKHLSMIEEYLEFVEWYTFQMEK